MKANNRDQEIINHLKYEFKQEMGLAGDLTELYEIEKNNKK